MSADIEMVKLYVPATESCVVRQYADTHVEGRVLWDRLAVQAIIKDAAGECAVAASCKDCPARAKLWPAVIDACVK